LTGWKDAFKLETLAAACAEAGDFAAAVRWQEKALELHTGDPKPARERLALYRQRRPYRQGGTANP
jgi:hypothetical protein